MDVLSVLVEIRDLLELSLPDKRPLSKKKKKRVKAKRKMLPRWRPSEFPFEKMQVGTIKRYQISEKDKIRRRIRHVNRRMKLEFHLPNHYRYITVIRNGRLYVQVQRDQ